MAIESGFVGTLRHEPGLTRPFLHCQSCPPCLTTQVGIRHHFRHPAFDMFDMHAAVCSEEKKEEEKTSEGP